MSAMTKKGISKGLSEGEGDALKCGVIKSELTDMQAEMSDTSREFSLDGSSFGAKKQKHKLLLQKQWLNQCIQVQLPGGLCNWVVPTKSQRRGKLRQFLQETG